MKIEKLNENKIRIILNATDLQEKNIDFHSFMSNSIESQDLFLDMLDKAEKEVGFVTKDCKILLEAIATSEGNFILTVTKVKSDSESKNNKFKKVNIKRKSNNLNKSIAIYSFNSFDDFCEFCIYINNSYFKSIEKNLRKVSLYLYNSKYYLILNNFSANVAILKSFCSNISEFGTFETNSEVFQRKLLEYGTPIMKTNAINICLKHFSK